MKLSDETLLKRIVETTIKEWKGKVKDVKLEDYEDWQIDLIGKLKDFIDKRDKEEDKNDTLTNV